VVHGHQPSKSPRVISGHLHPALRTAGQSFPCILTSPTQIILPAFSENAAGLDVATTLLPAPWRNTPFRCFVGAGVQVLDFGPLSTLRGRLSSSA
jgi:metallophosphoesterase superfamily enzyme